MVAWWWLLVAFAAGSVLPLALAAVVYVKALREFGRDFRDTERRIRAQQKAIQDRIDAARPPTTGLPF